ncbi:hypothetical protein SUDANB105_04080 [Streptomyces sp. enrichment culture]
MALPGGGLEPGEGPREGALRELREETGWEDLEPGPLLCTWEHGFTHSGILTWRWWTRPELAAEAEPVWPPELARLLDEWEAR